MADETIALCADCRQRQIQIDERDARIRECEAWVAAVWEYDTRREAELARLRERITVLEQRL